MDAEDNQLAEQLFRQLERGQPETWQCLVEIEAKFRSHGHQILLVGGAVRNLVLGLPLKDFDLATDAPPERTIRMFRSVIPTGIQHGTVTLVYRKQHFEITTFRLDGAYTDARRPDSVAFTPDVREDLKRRDFTINAMALDLAGRRLVDPHGGRLDLRRRLIRTVGIASERFNEDGLRIMRGLRFAAQLGFSLEAATWEAMSERLERLSGVSVERFRDELLKTLAAQQPSRGLYMMQRVGALGLFINGLDQAGEEDFARACIAADLLPPDPPELRLAAFFSALPAAAARAGLAGLRLPNASIRLVELLTGLGAERYDSAWSDAALRRLAARASRANASLAVAFLNAMALARDWLDYNSPERPAMLPVMLPASPSSDIAALDCQPAWTAQTDDLRRQPDPACREFSQRMADELAADRALAIGELRVNGRELQAAGIPASRELGAILDKLLSEVIDEPQRNQNGWLVARARELWGEMIQASGNRAS
jgi:tRNA nucleotidyltransferase/poly(A) polymerase